MLKNDYSRDIKLRCVVCGDTESFKVDDNDQTIICEKCGREYPGGRDELIELNQLLIDEEVEDIKAEVTNGVGKVRIMKSGVREMKDPLMERMRKSIPVILQYAEEMQRMVRIEINGYCK